MGEFYHSNIKNYTTFKISKRNHDKILTFLNMLKSKIIEGISDTISSNSEVIELILRFVLYDGYLKTLSHFTIENPLYFKKEEIRPLSIQIQTRKYFEQYLEYFKFINISVSKEINKEHLIELTYQSEPLDKILKLSFDDCISILFSIFSKKVESLTEKEFKSIFKEIYSK